MREGNKFYLLFCKIGFGFFFFLLLANVLTSKSSDFSVLLLGSLGVIDISDKIVRHYLVTKSLLLDHVLCVLSSVNL